MLLYLQEERNVQVARTHMRPQTETAGVELMRGDGYFLLGLIELNILT